MQSYYYNRFVCCKIASAELQHCWKKFCELNFWLWFRIVVIWIFDWGREHQWQGLKKGGDPKTKAFCAYFKLLSCLVVFGGGSLYNSSCCWTKLAEKALFVGGDKEAEVREDQREENVDAGRGSLQGISRRVRQCKHIYCWLEVLTDMMARLVEQPTCVPLGHGFETPGSSFESMIVCGRS